MCKAKLADIINVRADRGTATAAQAETVKKEGITDSKRFFKHQLFIAGLKEEIQTKIMEAGKTSIQESVTLVQELEVIHEDRKNTRSEPSAATPTPTTMTWARRTLQPSMPSNFKVVSRQ